MSQRLSAQFRNSMILCLLLLLPTLLVVESFYATTSSEKLYDESTFGPEMGSANMLRPGFRQPWSQFSGSIYRFQILQYCYAKQAARNALECSIMRPTLSVWQNALISPFSVNASHSLSWKDHVSFQGQKPNESTNLLLHGWRRQMERRCGLWYIGRTCHPRRQTARDNWLDKERRAWPAQDDLARELKITPGCSRGEYFTSSIRTRTEKQIDRSCPWYGPRTMPQRPR